MSILNDIFGGGGDDFEPIIPRLSPEGTTLEQGAFGPIQRGLSGTGFFPARNQATISNVIADTRKTVESTKVQALRNLRRIVPREDESIPNFILKQIEAAGARNINTARTGLAVQAAEDIPLARQLALAGVGGGVELGSRVLNISNQTGAFLQNAPGFGSELGGQLGFALADLVARAESGGGGSGLNVSAFNRPSPTRVGDIQTNQIPGSIELSPRNGLQASGLQTFARFFNQTQTA